MPIVYPQQNVSRYLCALLCFLAYLLAGTAEIRGQTLQSLGPCESGFVQQHSVPIRRVATAAAEETLPGGVRLAWLGHSSFFLTSPEGLHLLTDPHGLHPIPMTPDVVTVSNVHVTHSAVSEVPGAPQILWGLKPDRGWNPIALTLKDVSLFNVPSYTSRIELEESPIQNSIFVFRTGGLCLVHLGNLRHPLTPRQLQHIGKPDVLMIPVDGTWTMSYDDVLTVISQLQPLLVIPMHIDTPEHAKVFVTYTAGKYPVRRITGQTLTLHRTGLPVATEIVVFSHP